MYVISYEAFFSIKKVTIYFISFFQISIYFSSYLYQFLIINLICTFVRLSECLFFVTFKSFLTSRTLWNRFYHPKQKAIFSDGLFMTLVWVSCQIIGPWLNKPKNVNNFAMQNWKVEVSQSSKLLHLIMPSLFSLSPIWVRVI